MPNEDLQALYERGDFAALRRTAQAVLQDPAASPEARSLAGRYLARISVDVYVYATLAFALLLFCAIVLRYGFL
jgi:hypothetical protein